MKRRPGTRPTLGDLYRATPWLAPDINVQQTGGSLGRNPDLRLALLPHHIPAAPDRFDKFLATRRVGELFPQLADENIDDFHLRLVHAAVEVIKDHILGLR